MTDPPRRAPGPSPAASGGNAPRSAVTLVVPVYNEEGRFGSSSARFAEFLDSSPAGSEIVFADDGSLDSTVDLLEAFIGEVGANRARLLRLPHLGKGAAVRAGLASAANEVVAFCDVDLSTPLAEVNRLLAVAEASSVLVIASRSRSGDLDARGEHGRRELLGRVFNRFVQMTLLPGISDTQCGAKAARRELWEQMEALTTEEGFAWDLEAIVVARALGIEVREVGVEWVYREGSRVKPIRDGVSMVKSVWVIRRRSRRLGASRP